MVSRNADRPRMSILLGLGRAGLAVLAGAAFAYMAWNPLPPPPIDSATAEVEEEDVSVPEADGVGAVSPDAAMKSSDRAFVAPEVWALVTPRSGAFALARGTADALNGGASATGDRRCSTTAQWVAGATGMQRSRGPPVGVAS